MMSQSVWKIAVIISILHTTQAQFLVCYNGSSSNFKNVTLEDADQQITSGYIDINKLTVFIVHGYKGSPATQGTNLIADKFILCGNINVCCIDWSKLANYGISFLDYLVVIKNADVVSEKLAKACILLEKLGFDITAFHVVGHSLGAHLSGWAGSKFNGITGRKFPRITGLDPAGPFFKGEYVSFKRISQNDAVTVVIVHTDGNRYGTNEILGHIDIIVCPIEYDKTGVQPGCPTFNPLVNPPLSPGDTCSHQRSVLLFLEVICAVVCQLLAALAESVANWADPNYKPTLIICMGDNFNQSIRGVFYLRTNAQPPFGMGVAGTRPQ